MKKVFHEEQSKFTYDSEEERSAHIEEMKSFGWEVGSKVQRIKEGFSIWDSDKEEAYDWYAEFWKTVQKSILK